jgi:hypothetical protein
MAASNPTAITLMPISEKLARGNFVVWKAQVIAILHGAQLTKFLDGSNPAPEEKLMIKVQKEKAEEVKEVPNPAYASWKAQEQQVLSYLLTSVSRDVLIQVAALPSAATIWKHIETSFSSQSRARVINTRMALATTQKGSSTSYEYLSKMKMLADEMALADKKLDDEELCSYILAGLDFEYNSLVSSIAARVEPITVGELYSQLLSFENRLELQSGGQVQNNHQMTSSANNASRGRGSFSRGRGGRNSRGGTAGGAAEEISLPRQRIDSLLANCVEGPITWCSSAIKNLIIHTWEKRSLPMQHTHMGLILVGMQIQG